MIRARSTDTREVYLEYDAGELRWIVQIAVISATLCAHSLSWSIRPSEVTRTLTALIYILQHHDDRSCIIFMLQHCGRSSSRSSYGGCGLVGEVAVAYVSTIQKKSRGARRWDDVCSPEHSNTRSSEK